MYKILITPSGEEYIKKLDESDEYTSVIIPKNESNYHYQEYLKWLAEGNTPEPADE